MYYWVHFRCKINLYANLVSEKSHFISLNIFLADRIIRRFNFCTNAANIIMYIFLTNIFFYFRLQFIVSVARVKGINSNCFSAQSHDFIFYIMYVVGLLELCLYNLICEIFMMFV